MPLYLRLILLTASASDVGPAAAAHEREVDALRAGGELRGSGRLRAAEGYFEVFEVADLYAAEALARENPLIAAGLGSWILRELDRYDS